MLKILQDTLGTA